MLHVQAYYDRSLGRELAEGAALPAYADHAEHHNKKYGTMSTSREMQFKQHGMAMAWLQDHHDWLSLTAQTLQQDADPNVPHRPTTRTEPLASSFSHTCHLLRHNVAV